MGIKLIRAIGITVTERERKRPEAAHLEHREGRNVDWILTIKVEHCLDVVPKDDTHTKGYDDPVLLLTG